MASPDKTPLEHRIARALRASELRNDDDELLVLAREYLPVVVRLQEALLEAAELLSDVYGDWDAREKYVAVVSPDKPPEPQTPEERIAEVLHSVGFGEERHRIAKDMLKLAEDYPGVLVGGEQE